MATSKRKSKNKKNPFVAFFNLSRKRKPKSKSKNKMSNSVAPENNRKKKNKKRTSLLFFKRLLLKSVRNILIFIGIILICFTFFFEIKTVSFSSGLFNSGKELVLIEKWQLNSIHPLKLQNYTTIMLNDSSFGFILANWENNVAIEDNKLVVDGQVQGLLPTSYDNNMSFFLSDNEYLILLHNNKVAVVNVDMIKGELSGRYNISKFNNFF